MFQFVKIEWNIYSLTWYFLQFIFDVFEIICGFVIYPVSTIKQYLPHRTESYEREKQFIESHKKHLDKIPYHLAIILGTEAPDFHVLSKMIFWCFSVGIPNISFYDHEGQLVTNNHKLYKCLSQWRKDNERICWNINTRDICSSQIIYQNGLQKELSVNFLSPRECKSKIAEVCRNLANDADISSKSLNIQAVNRHMLSIVKPDPDLALYFGTVCCTYGLLPWHIRLTEFLPIESQRKMTVNTFISKLYKYAKCEQRFGY